MYMLAVDWQHSLSFSPHTVLPRQLETLRFIFISSNDYDGLFEIVKEEQLSVVSAVYMVASLAIPIHLGQNRWWQFDPYQVAWLQAIPTSRVPRSTGMVRSTYTS
jgi:hypothetical protein